MARSMLMLAMMATLVPQLAFGAGDDHDDHDDHDGHDHDDHGCEWSHPWEWAGVFHVHHGGTLTWFAQKVGGSYADASMKIVLSSASSANHEGLEGLEAAAETSWNGTFTDATSGDSLSIGGAYNLIFDQTSWVTMFKITVPAETDLAFFCQHFPSEFVPAGYGYLMEEDGEMMTTAYSISEASCDDHSGDATVAGNDGLMGEVIAACFITTIPSVFAIVILVLTCKGVSEYAETIMHYSNAAASGVIFAVAVFLLMPESYLMMMGGKSESAAAATWGSAVLGGWLVGIMVHQIAHLVRKGKEPAVSEEQRTVENVETGESSKKVKQMDWSHAIPVFWGDLIHNISDGMILGFAFYACGTGFAWKLMGGIIAHELPQELADFYIFVNKAGMKWYVALLLNFISGLSAVVGGVIAYYVDVSSEVSGAFLAIGAGTFLYVACTDLGPQVAETHEGAKRPWASTLLTIFVWLLGATVLALVLLDHEHCYVPVAEGEVDPHAGHAHR